MTVKTEKEITKEYIKGIVEDEANENYYLSFDVDARIEFYNKNKDFCKPHSNWLDILFEPKLCKNRHDYHWCLFLFSFCFDNMEEDFREKIKLDFSMCKTKKDVEIVLKEFSKEDVK